MSDEHTPPMGRIRSAYADCAFTGPKQDALLAEFDRAIAAHDQALRQEIKQQMVERAYFHIAWEKGLTIVPTGPDRAKVPPHWVEAATARVAHYLDIIRGEGPA